MIHMKNLYQYNSPRAATYHLPQKLWLWFSSTYRGASLIINRPTLRPYSKPIPGTTW